MWKKVTRRGHPCEMCHARSTRASAFPSPALRRRGFGPPLGRRAACTFDLFLLNPEAVPIPPPLASSVFEVIHSYRKGDGCTDRLANLDLQNINEKQFFSHNPVRISTPSLSLSPDEKIARPMDCLQIATVDEDGAVPRPSAASKVSWVSPSVSVASSSSQRRANDLRVFTFEELEAATRGFSRDMMIGEGEFGCVYKGVVRVSDFDDGIRTDCVLNIYYKCSVTGLYPPVLNIGLAFTSRLKTKEKLITCLDEFRGKKCFYYMFEPQSFPVSKFLLQGHLMGSVILHSSIQGHKEWINEVNILGVVKHPNLVKLVGYCAEDDERGIRRLLVYELMHKKSLEDHLFIREESPLSWMARLRIAQDTARGLAHLHEEMDFQIIFLDLKTSDILLDENFNAKLSDFGRARQGPAAGLSHISTSSVVRPTRYAAPEYIQTGRLTARSDVWSFGVVLYELITGRRAVEKNMPCNEQKLLDWVKPYVSNSIKFHLIVDPRLGGQYCIKSAKNLAALANKCLEKNAKSRPKMSEVVEMLGKIISETSSENDSAPQQGKETQGKETNGKKEETKKSIWKFNWRNCTLR
ncbi:hypothetical protein RHSIM_Rhsim01G0227900 [Rhododendron simsii]|uniref:Protein kinase domain-containing protein n=1 Tax=Rhododendron simsii TaxID=118357 RepID=A0A834HHC0_RHOSS|nr:hypothetical protein RHSIM_Rhsim01G0227900 [Rhododendron simsii]